MMRVVLLSVFLGDAATRAANAFLINGMPAHFAGRPGQSSAWPAASLYADSYYYSKL
jgi:hypothetical protein